MSNRNKWQSDCSYYTGAKRFALTATGSRAVAAQLMKNTAALAAVSWYLMAPPFHAVSNSTVVWDASTPLSEWTRVDSFDTAEECLDELHSLYFKKYKGRELTPEEKGFVKSFECLASDNPRLRPR